MVSETSETSITWTWNASEGATGYVVQANTDEMWDATDTVTFEGLPFTTETTYTAMDLEPETAVFVRVAAAAGSLEAPLVSAFTTHVSGMSAMPPPEPVPEPEPMDPVMATFTPPDTTDKTLDLVCDDDPELQNAASPLCTDKSQRMTSAMAVVNPDMTVMSNATAVIAPMNFAEGANPVKIHEGENMPFMFVTWEILQSKVVTEGAQFKIQRVTIGANQEEMPIGDVAYVTCGPFVCEEGMEAPEISVENSPVCTTFEADVQFSVGILDADGRDMMADEVGTEGVDEMAAEAQPGIDLGLVYTANAGFATTHDFGSFSATGFGGKDTTESGAKALTPGVKDPTSTTKDANKDITDSSDNVVVGINACELDESATMGTPNPLYTQTGLDAVHKPEECARVTSSSDLPYFADYSVTVTPSAALAWSSNTWTQIPAAAARKCAGTTFAASDDIDVCELLEDEVALMDDSGVAATPVVMFGTSPSHLAASTERVNAEDQSRLAGFDLQLPIDQTRWMTLTYYDTTTRGQEDTADLYDQSYVDDAGEEITVAKANLVATTTAATALGTYSYNAAGRLTGDDGAVWVPILNADGDPLYGDLGKVDGARGETADRKQTTGDTGTVTVENNVTLTSAAYAGPFANDNVADNFLGSRSSAVSGCSATDGGSAGVAAGAKKVYLLDGDDPGPGAIAWDDPRIAAAGITDASEGQTYDVKTLRTNGSLCDATDVEIDTSVTFTDKLGFGCAVERSYTLTCNWDADGQMSRDSDPSNLISDDPAAAIADLQGLRIGVANAKDFVDCTVELN